VPLSNILPILFGPKSYNYNSYDFNRLNFTSIGYTFYLIFDYINYTAAPLSFIIACIFIFKHLIEHRLNLVDEESFHSSFVLIASKHYDFFLPLIVYFLTIIPYFIFDKSMDCLRADSIAVSCTAAVINQLYYAPLTLTFFFYVYLSKIYYKEFWQTSPIGRFLIHVKKRFINCFKHQIFVIDV